MRRRSLEAPDEASLRRALEVENARLAAELERVLSQHRARVEAILLAAESHSRASLARSEEARPSSAPSDSHAARARVDDAAPKDERVVLDVGGRLFAFHRSRFSAPTVTGSFFDAAFAERWRTSHTSSPVFIDRDPRLFELYVAPFLRGRVRIDVAPADLALLLEEADYYLLDQLKALVLRRAWQWTPTSNGHLTDRYCKKEEDVRCNDACNISGTTLTHVLVGDCISLGSMPLSQGVHEWQVRLVTGCGGVLLGVSLDGASRIASQRNVTLRWRLDTSTGRFAQAGEIRGTAFGLPIDGLREPGAVVCVRLDFAAHSLSFSSDQGHTWYVATADLPLDAVLVPYVHLTRINTVVTLL